MWNAVKDMETAKEIISNPTYKKTGKFEPDCFTIDQVEVAGKVVVDFGCGVGRNAKYILTKNPRLLVCYDFANMIKLAKEFIGDSNIMYITYPIEHLAGIGKCDIVLADIVLQHINERELRQEVLPTLNKLLQPTDGKLLINSRGYTDENRNIWKIINDFFAPITPIDITQDNDIHQNGVFIPR